MRYVPLFMLKTCRVFSHLNGASLAVFESTGRSGLSLDLYFLLVVVIIQNGMPTAKWNAKSLFMFGWNNG